MAEQSPAIFRRASLARQVASGVAVPWSQVDGELYDLFDAYMRLRAQVATVIKPDGTLQGVGVPTALSLRWSQRVGATAGQTTFAVPAYDIALDIVGGWSNGLRIDPSTIVKTSATVVTLPAQSAGAVVVLEANSNAAGLLARLASVSAADGASLVGVRDLANYWTGATTEDVLAEIGIKLTTPSFLTTLLGLANYLLKAGGTMSGNIDMATFKMLNLGAPVANGQAIRYEDFSTANIISLIGTTLASTYVTKAGDTMTGALNGPAPTVGTNYANKAYVDAQFSSALPTGVIVAYSGAAAPVGWVLTNGQALSRTDPINLSLFNLYSAQGFPFGNGDGATTFNVPNTRQRAVIHGGAGSQGAGVSGSGTVTGGTGLSARAVGQWGGEEAHLQTATELAAHTHTTSNAGDGNIIRGTGGGGGTGLSGNSNENAAPWVTNTMPAAVPMPIMNPWICVGPGIVRL